MVRLLSIILFFLSPLSAEIKVSQESGPIMTFDYQKQSEDFYRKHLPPEVFRVMREAGTEPSFSGKYDKFYEPGTYYCAGCGGDFPLYVSKAKFDSGTGWPSFYEPLGDKAVITRPDPHSFLRILGAAPTEVICARCHSHLGHVFNDGPQPTGKRYCMNSVALVFVPEGQTPKRTYAIK